MNSPNEMSVELPLPLAAELQDDLLTADHDLDRLQALLCEACERLQQGFLGATEQLQHLNREGAAQVQACSLATRHLDTAVVALQFQDMASQLIGHTRKRLRFSVDRLARQLMDDEDDGVQPEAPLRPNPVTQSEMNAGSIELF